MQPAIYVRRRTHGTLNQIQRTLRRIRIDILVDDRPGIGAKTGGEIAKILHELADKFESGGRPMIWNEDSVQGASVDWH